MRSRTMLSAAVLAVACSQVATAQEQQRARPNANVGTLTCTSEQADRREVPDARLTCRFDPIAGPAATFSGSLVRLGPADVPAGKRVFSWSVLGPSTDLAADDLAGRYVGITGDEKTGALIGGRERSILLQPLTSGPQLGRATAPSVLELRLETMRT